MFTKKVQVLAADEVEEGVSPTLDGDDAVLVLDPELREDQQFSDRMAASQTLSPEGKTIGRSTLGLNFAMDLRGGGTLTTRPPSGGFLRSCGMREVQGRVLTLSVAVSGGPFVLWEAFTATGGKSGRITRAAANGATSLSVVMDDTSAQLVSTDVVTGATSGATGTVSANNAGGWIYTPDSMTAVWAFFDDVIDGTPILGEVWQNASGTVKARLLQLNPFNNPVVASSAYFEPLLGKLTAEMELTGMQSGATGTLQEGDDPGQVRTTSRTIQHNLDGFRQILAGARGTATFLLNTAETGRINFEFSGQWKDHEDAMPIANPNYGSSASPLRIVDATITIDGFALLISSLEIALSNTLTQTFDPSTPDGTRSYRITGRDITARLDPEATYKDQFDWITRIRTVQYSRVEIRVGASAGNRFTCLLPKVQLVAAPIGDREGIATRAVEAHAVRVGEGDDEAVFIFD